MKLFLFREKNTGYFLGIETVTKKYNLFDLPGEMNIMDHLAYSFSLEQAENWLDWFTESINFVVEEHLLPSIPDLKIEIVPFIEKK